MDGSSYEPGKWSESRPVERCPSSAVRHTLVLHIPHLIGSTMSGTIDEDDVKVEMPKMKTVSKPKNLKKRKRAVEATDEDESGFKKSKPEDHGDVGEYVPFGTLNVARLERIAQAERIQN